SFFAWDLQEDFMGGYDHGRRAGVVHVGNHHLVCGAKLWEWGTGEQGRAWDQILTDDDGPYAELMVGAFSDNQPDYSWIQPCEVKTVKQYWYPVKEIGGFKNANLHGAVNLELRPDDVAFVGVCTTSRRPGARLVVESNQEVLCEETVDVAPGQPLLREFRVPASTREADVHVTLLASDGEPLVSYQPVERPPADTLPKPVAPPAKPADISSVEELYLAGLRIEQIHNPSVDPRDYYREALRRDPDDTRCNIMIGIDCLRRGLPAEAETHLRRAVDRLTRDYTRAREGEAHYQLGLALRALHREEEAYDQFYRAAWDRKFHSPAYFQLAELSCRRGDYAQALEQIERSLSTNTLDTNALGLQAALLRRLDRPADAASVAAAALAIDPLDFRAHNERSLSQLAGADPASAAETLERLTRLMRDDVQAYLELATDYMHAGLWLDALQVLQRPVRGTMQPAGSYPLVHYYLGYLHLAMGDQAEAAACFAQGSAAPTDYCFPFRLETAEVLKTALQANANDARAEYYLGNLLFDLQPDAAIAHWERARTLDESLAIVHRNLGWAYYRVKNDLAGAIGHYEKAVSCNQRDPRLFLELDLLYEFANVPPDRRLDALQANHAIVAEREDSLLREITVLVLTGNHGQAIRHLAENRFHAQEGRSEIHDVFVDAHLLEGLRLMQAREYQEALTHFLKASEYPENLSVGRPRNDPRAPEVNYHTGVAYKALNNRRSAAECFRKAAEQRETGSWPLTRYYQALSMIELGRRDEAKDIFDGLIGRGRDQLVKGTSADFFAKFGEQETRRSQEASAHFLIGLGLVGKGDRAAAREQFAAAVKLNVSHVWARYHLAEFP
ncbi:MAG: DUF5107 domain-containing protein, partial [Planctomycetes bacterium]|nr:DUF5107 domain-containing protein [Planctomycetota bacterium]